MTFRYRPALSRPKGAKRELSWFLIKRNLTRMIKRRNLSAAEELLYLDIFLYQEKSLNIFIFITIINNHA
jgi:hypothetical protein